MSQLPNTISRGPRHFLPEDFSILFWLAFLSLIEKKLTTGTERERREPWNAVEIFSGRLSPFLPRYNSLTPFRAPSEEDEKKARR